MAGNRARALKSYDKAHAWKELFTLAKLEKLPEDEMQNLVKRIASECRSFVASLTALADMRAPLLLPQTTFLREQGMERLDVSSLTTAWTRPRRPSPTSAREEITRRRTVW